MAKRRKPTLRKPIRVPRDSRKARVRNSRADDFKNATDFIATSVAGFALSGFGAAFARQLMRNPLEASQPTPTFSWVKVGIQAGIFFGATSLLQTLSAREEAVEALKTGMLAQIGISSAGLLLSGVSPATKEYFGLGSPRAYRMAPSLPVSSPEPAPMPESNQTVSGYQIPTAPLYPNVRPFSQVGYA